MPGLPPVPGVRGAACAAGLGSWARLPRWWRRWPCWRPVRLSIAAPGAFYTPPAAVASRPGLLLRSEPFTRDVPADARAWLILYTTTRDTGVPAVASAIVVAPAHPPAGPRPVIAWTHGTTG